MNLTLKVWRQHDAKAAGQVRQLSGAGRDAGHVVPRNAGPAQRRSCRRKGEAPVAFEHDCREGICGSCGFLINGVAHGGHRGTTVCQLSMRFFKDGDSLTLEPWRAKAFPVLRDLARRSLRVRPHHSSRRLHQRAHRRRAGRRTPSWFRRKRRETRVRRGRLHRMRRVRGRVPERRGHAVHRRRRSRISIRCPRDSRSAISARWTWSRPCPRKSSAAAPITASAKRFAPRKFPSNSSAA